MEKPLIGATRRAERIQPGIYSHNNVRVIAVLDLKCMHPSVDSPGESLISKETFRLGRTDCVIIPIPHYYRMREHHVGDLVSVLIIIIIIF